MLINENLKKISYSAISKLKFFVKTDMNYPLMPKATAVWLLENTGLTFDQIADFCGLHVLEVHGIADGEVAKGIRGVNQITDAQISKLIGTTKNTINLIRNKTHWNYSNLRAKDPVLLGLCTQADLNYVSELAKQKLEAKKDN